MADEKSLVEQVADHISAISSLLGIKVTESNKDTPNRVAKMYCNEIFRNREGANLSELDSKMKLFPNEGVHEPVVVSDIPFWSTCFTGKTPVRMKSGVKCIKDVKVGDVAVTFDESGNLIEKPVTHVMKREVTNTLVVHTSTGKSLRCTPDHPFYVQGVGWVEARHLEPHDTLRVLNKGKDFGKSRTWDFTINEGYEFGYVLGAIASDGSTWRNQTRLEVNDEGFAKTFSHCLKKAFNLDSEVVPSSYTSGFTPGKYDHRNLVRVVSGYFVDYLSQVFGGTTGSKSFNFPEVVLNSFESFEGFVQGYYMGDGTYYKDRYVRLLTTNKSFAQRISQILGTTLSYGNSCYIVRVPLHLCGFHKREVFKDRFRKRFNREFLNTSPLKINPLMSFAEVVSVQELPPHKVSVYNFEVEDNHTYLAGDVWVHNCEHHWMPFGGTVTVSYIPGDSIIGLSKIPRVVKYFSKRPQLQERLTQDIGKYLVGVLHPKELWVGVTATHTCVMCRGAESSCSTTSSYHYKEDVQ